MQAIRSIARSGSFLTRAVMGLALTLGVIVGLLAMHTLSGDDLGHTHHPANIAAVADTDLQSMGTHSDGTNAEHCDCGPAAPSEDHSAQTMACVLGLLITLLLVALPLILGRATGWARLHGLAPGRAWRALARARPPSLLVLSISRT